MKKSELESLTQLRTLFCVSPDQEISLHKDFDPGFHGSFEDKDSAVHALESDDGIKEDLAELQERLYAEGRQSLLIIIQAMDAAGKDSTIKHVMSGLNPQGCQVTSFKTPSAVELAHGWLWRCAQAVPPKGFIGIFNRSYYEEVLVTKVHPEILNAQKLPEDKIDKKFWSRRYDQINDFEKYLTSTGTTILKFFLNVSHDQQRKRFLDRLNDPTKMWKFSMSDLTERDYWDDYQAAYEDLLNNTSTDQAPWYVIPADKKWFTHLVVAGIILSQLNEMNPQFPVVSDEQRQKMEQLKSRLES